MKVLVLRIKTRLLQEVYCSILTFKKFAASKRRAQGDSSFVKYLLQWAQEERTILIEVHSPKGEAVRDVIAPSHANPTMCVERSLFSPLTVNITQP